MTIFEVKSAKRKSPYTLMISFISDILTFTWPHTIPTNNTYVCGQLHPMPTVVPVVRNTCDSLRPSSRRHNKCQNNGNRFSWKKQRVYCCGVGYLGDITWGCHGGAQGFIYCPENTTTAVTNESDSSCIHVLYNSLRHLHESIEL